MENPPLFSGFYTSHVVRYFFHQHYVLYISRDFYLLICSFSASQLTSKKHWSVCVLRGGLPGTSTTFTSNKKIPIRSCDPNPVLCNCKPYFFGWQRSSILHGLRADILQTKDPPETMWLLVVPVQMFWCILFTIWCRERGIATWMSSASGMVVKNLAWWQTWWIHMNSCFSCR